MFFLLSSNDLSVSVIERQRAFCINHRWGLKLNGSRAHLHLSSVGGSRAHLERTKNGALAAQQHQPQLCMSWFFGPWNTANLHSYKLIKQQFSLQHHRPGLLQTIGIFSLSKIISTTIKIKDFYLKMTFHTFSDWKLL